MRVAIWAAEEWGVLSLDELRECGLSRDAVAVRVRNGRLHRMYCGVYAVGHANPPLQGRFLAAVKACGPGAVLSHFSAAALFGFVAWDHRYPEVTVPGSATRVHRGLRVHRTCMLDSPDIARHEGIVTTSPARTLLDLASMLDYRPLRRAVRQAQSLRLVSLRQLAEVLTRLGARRGVRKLEDVVLDMMLSGGLAHPDVNVPLVLDGRRVIPDFRWPERRLVVEADGAAWHDDKLAREDDSKRQALLEAHGERVLRVTWDQAIARPAQTLSRLRAAGAPPAVRESISSA